MERITIIQIGTEWTVKQGDKYADGLTYEEMLCVVVGLTMPEKRPCIHWMMTAEENKRHQELISGNWKNSKKEKK